MSSRSKTHRSNPHLTREEKAAKRIAHAAKVSKEYTPKESIALDIARQNVGLRDHLAKPEEYYGLLDTIEHNPQIQNFETYVAFLHHFRGRTKAQATEILYHLYALRTVEAWKQVAQTYTISGSSTSPRPAHLAGPTIPPITWSGAPPKTPRTLNPRAIARGFLLMNYLLVRQLVSCHPVDSADQSFVYHAARMAFDYHSDLPMGYYYRESSAFHYHAVSRIYRATLAPQC